MSTKEMIALLELAMQTLAGIEYLDGMRIPPGIVAANEIMLETNRTPEELLTKARRLRAMIAGWNEQRNLRVPLSPDVLGHFELELEKSR